MENLALSLSLIYNNVPHAHCVLVRKSGSAPQNPGARLLVQRDGVMHGTIGGGCVEMEVRRLALNALRNGKAQLHTFRMDDDYGYDDGLICGGRVWVFIQPKPEQWLTSLQAAQRLQQEGNSGAWVLVTQSPQHLGNAFCVCGEEVTPTLPDDWRQALFEASAQALRQDQPQYTSLHEHVEVYVEPVQPQPTLVLVGAGHIAHALAPMASAAGFDVLVIDDRPSFANPERFPTAARCIVGNIAQSVRELPADHRTYIVIVTRGHRHDADALRVALHKPAAYIGMIGSRRKITVIYRDLLQKGEATPEQLARVHAPLGLDIGAQTVGEIAVSILAELVAVRRGKLYGRDNPYIASMMSLYDISILR
ncbi:MAG: XdhC/CoxI family protein [Armatimonadota bacterium]|nr:XdhC/CoxI family protein [Armatimonadota bacterium]